MTPHTAGPWCIATDATGVPQHIRVNKYDTVCSFLTSVKRDFSTAEIETNAQLIVAAPDLLEALEALLEDVGNANSMPGAVKARAAIKKATKGQ